MYCYIKNFDRGIIYVVLVSNVVNGCYVFMLKLFVMISIIDLKVIELKLIYIKYMYNI